MIKIKNGSKGYYLQINGLYINHGFDGIKSIKSTSGGIPYGATEWISVKAIRDFWNTHRIQIIESLETPYFSDNGSLIKIYKSDEYSQIVVWEGVLISKETEKDFIPFLKETFPFLSKEPILLEREIVTGPDIFGGVPVPETGGRHDVFFAVHNDDLTKFAGPRFQCGMRWLEDVYNNQTNPVYPSWVYEKYPRTW